MLLAASSASSPESLRPVPYPLLVPSCKSFSQFEPKKWKPSAVNNRFKAITIALITGSTFFTIGSNKFPIVLARFDICCFVILYWFATEPRVFAWSPHATFDWSKIAIKRNCIFSACVIADRDFVTPRLYAYCCNVAFVISIPNLYSALDCPINPDWKFVITDDKSSLVYEDISAASIESAFAVLVLVSPQRPTAFVTDTIFAW